MTGVPGGFWAESRARFRRRGGARIGVAWVMALLACGALAPWITNSYPLRVVGPDGVRWPVVEALRPSDWLWSGALLVAMLGAALARWRFAARIVMVTVAVATIALAFGAQPRNLAVEDWDALEARRDVDLTHAWVPHGPSVIDKDAILVPPGSPGHPLGTDTVGRDVLARLLHGARTSLLVGLVAALTATVLGLSVGALAGWYRGRVDVVLSWVIQVVACFPVLVLVLTVCAFSQPSLLLLMLLIGAFGWTETARLVRGEILRVREMGFVESARALGASDFRVLVRHAVPHALGPVTVQAALGVGGAVLIEATLAFLGLSPIETPSWGRLLQEGRDVLPDGEHLIVIPGLLVFATVCAWNLVGEAWRDATDARAEEVR